MSRYGEKDEVMSGFDWIVFADKLNFIKGWDLFFKEKSVCISRRPPRSYLITHISSTVGPSQGLLGTYKDLRDLSPACSRGNRWLIDRYFLL